MSIKQISVFMENRPGRLAEITRVLAKNNIDMRAINIAATTDFGILRRIVSEPDRAEKVLRDNDMTASITDVIAISIDDKIGSFSDVMSSLEQGDISVEYIYSFIGEKSAKAGIVIRTNNGEKALELFEKNGVNILSPADLEDMKYV